MTKRLYDDYVGKISTRFTEALSEIEAQHNFDLGDEFEVALCRALRKIVPPKAGICRGFVVDAQGDVAGDDIIIYDRLLYPTLRSLAEEDYSRKEKVPIEAVYAYLEAKHTLELDGEGPSSLKHACEQVSKVKALCAKREAIPANRINAYLVINTKDPSTISVPPGFPEARNPIYVGVVGRRVRKTGNQELLADPIAIHHLLSGRSMGHLHFPDLIVAGFSNVLVPVIPELPSLSVSFRSPFFISDRSTLSASICNKAAFGIGVCLLLYALDWIILGPMPWPEIIGDAMGLTRAATNA
ncbi:MAG TPA: DUF6602 domain-containing protein [Gemmataceae bacterium]|nr:DUF6602 domain-containing protein [Gemmataceae bacterium]